jgi:hypothetical protein
MKEPPRRYASAAAFRVALETRLKAISQAEGIDLQRLRRQVSFDRLLARLFAEKNAPWLLKGGYAMNYACGQRARPRISTSRYRPRWLMFSMVMS